MTRGFGRHAYGVAAILYGILTLYWHGVNTWPQLEAFAKAPYGEALGYLFAAAAIGGGLAIQWRRTARLGAFVLAVFFFLFSVFYIPGILKAPRVYDSWGNFFEQFSLFSGALVAYAGATAAKSRGTVRAAEVGRTVFAICTISFALEQAFYLSATAGLVPKWMPLGPTFWAVATTIFLALGAVAILSGRQALLAARLITAMLLLFGLLVWVPTLIASPRSHFDWSEGAETFAIAAAAWILADYLGSTSRATNRRRR